MKIPFLLRLLFISCAMAVIFLPHPTAADGEASLVVDKKKGKVEDPAGREEEEEEVKPACKRYRQGEATMSLCLLEADEYESQNKRVTHMNMYLNNTGTKGICNITLWVDGMDSKRIVDYWPKRWINRTDTEVYLAPGEGFELGANVRLSEGYPDYYIATGFHTCDAPDYTPKGYQYCTMHGDASTGVLLEFCEDEHYDSWMEVNGSRTMHAQGRISNNGTTDICFLNFTVSRFRDATNMWPQWFPRMNTENSVAPLRPGDSIPVGADVPSAGFQRPHVTLLDFARCPPGYQPGGGDDASGAVKPKLRKSAKNNSNSNSNGGAAAIGNTPAAAAAAAAGRLDGGGKRMMMTTAASDDVTLPSPSSSAAGH